MHTYFLLFVPVADWASSAFLGGTRGIFTGVVDGYLNLKVLTMGLCRLDSISEF